MNAPVGARVFSRYSMALLALAGSSFLAGCTDPDTFVPIAEFSGPAGAISGTLTYAGPPPCTENGRIIGAALLLAFNKNLLPPPEGLGSGAASLNVVPGETLFASIRDKLVFAADNSLRCPDSSAPPVSASATWALAPLPAGTYQVRGFYDRDGDFDPAFSISNLPSKGDVGGGAVSNATEVLTKGEAPKFTEIDLGVVDQATGKLVIPPTGSYVQGIGVTFAQPLALERPVFHPSAVADETPAANKDPKKITIHSDFEFNTFPPSEKDFIRITMTAGVPADEIDTAAKTPFFMPVKNPAASLYMTVEDSNRDGVVNDQDSVPESALIPSLYPLSVFSKLLAGEELRGQTKPRVIIQGLTLFKGLILTTSKLPKPDPMNPSKFLVPQSFEPEIVVALRPAAICVDPADPSIPGVLVLSRKTAKNGAVILADESAVKQGLERQFKRPFNIAYGCLPQGNYAMNLVYPTGQAWTQPNEAGVCAESEPESSDGKECVGTTSKRALLGSQGAMLIVGPPKDAAYCKANPTPKACSPL
jgi:hypothetical protein